jgi:hypothetical protein
MKRIALLLATGVLAVFAFVAGPLPVARANGVPQLVKLAYIEGVSNWGPRDAEGVLEFSFAEAYARVDVKNLVPVAGTKYEGWLVTPTGETLLVGEIVIAPSGVGTLQAKLNGLSRYDYNLFVITGRADGSASGPIPGQKSIAGRFAVLKDAAGAKPGDSRPATLPDTGEQPGPGLFQRLVPTLAITGAAAILAAAWYRLKHRRDSRD